MGRVGVRNRDLHQEWRRRPSGQPRDLSDLGIGRLPSHPTPTGRHRHPRHRRPARKNRGPPREALLAGQADKAPLIQTLGSRHGGAFPAAWHSVRAGSSGGRRHVPPTPTGQRAPTRRRLGKATSDSTATVPNCPPVHRQSVLRTRPPILRTRPRSPAVDAIDGDDLSAGPATTKARREWWRRSTGIDRGTEH